MWWFWSMFWGDGLKIKLTNPPVWEKMVEKTCNLVKGREDKSEVRLWSPLVEWRSPGLWANTGLNLSPYFTLLTVTFGRYIWYASLPSNIWFAGLYNEIWSTMPVLRYGLNKCCLLCSIVFLYYLKQVLWPSDFLLCHTWWFLGFAPGSALR